VCELRAVPVSGRLVVLGGKITYLLAAASLPAN
jgi:hypothetical protein